MRAYTATAKVDSVYFLPYRHYLHLVYWIYFSVGLCFTIFAPYRCFSLFISCYLLYYIVHSFLGSTYFEAKRRLCFSLPHILYRPRKIHFCTFYTKLSYI